MCTSITDYQWATNTQIGCRYTLRADQSRIFFIVSLHNTIECVSVVRMPFMLKLAKEHREKSWLPSASVGMSAGAIWWNLLAFQMIQLPSTKNWWQGWSAVQAQTEKLFCPDVGSINGWSINARSINARSIPPKEKNTPTAPQQILSLSWWGKLLII